MLFFTIIAVLVMGVLGIPLCYQYAWSPLHHLSLSYGVQHREGNVPILAQFNSFFVKRFWIKQEDYSVDDDSYHEIIAYLENSACTDLPTITTVYKYNEAFPPPQLVPVYMLEHSTISFQASASTPNDYSNTAYFYVIRSVENSLHFDPNCKDCRHRIRVGQNGVSLTTSLVLQIPSNDYYSFKLRVPQVVTLTYNLSVEVKQVDIDATNSTILGTIYPNSDDQTTGKSVGLQSGQQCLFADIVFNSNITHDHTFLEVNIEPRLDAGIGITVSLLLILLFSVLLLEIFLYFSFKKCRAKLSNTESYEVLV